MAHAVNGHREHVVGYALPLKAMGVPPKEVVS